MEDWFYVAPRGNQNLRDPTVWHRKMCADDGGFIRPHTLFNRVHVSASDEAILGVLKAAIGRTVTIQGEAFGAHTGQHRAPLVLMANRAPVAGKVR